MLINAGSKTVSVGTATMRVEVGVPGGRRTRCSTPDGALPPRSVDQGHVMLCIASVLLEHVPKLVFDQRLPGLDEVLEPVQLPERGILRDQVQFKVLLVGSVRGEP